MTEADNAHSALARTSQLINLDFFDGLVDEDAISAELRRTLIRIVADERNLAAAAGQSALVSLVQLTAMMGVDVDVVVPDVELAGAQPPLHGSMLLESLVDYGSDLIPGARIGVDLGEPDVTFVLGDARAPDGPAIRVSGGPWTASVASTAMTTGMRWDGSWPFGALASGGAAAAEALRNVLPRIARQLGVELPTRRLTFTAGQPVFLDLSIPGLHTQAIDVGDVDFVSAGAITNVAISTLMRVPDVRGHIRVIDDDDLEVSNLNRYPLARRSLVGAKKVSALADYSTSSLSIVPIENRYSADSEMPLASMVCIGVDHIPSRWAVQAAWPEWLCVGATGHLEVRVTTHVPGTPCAACAHPPDDGEDGDVPTISWVSHWAGLLQARELLAAAQGLSPTSPSYWCSPFGLMNELAIAPRPLAPRRGCRLACLASRSVAT
jgi:hypothetical protein